MNSRKKLLVIGISILIIILIIIFIIKKTKKDEPILTSAIKNYDLSMSNISTTELQVEERIQNTFTEIRELYQENRQINARDKIENYYNNVRLEMEKNEVSLSFVNLEDIPTTDLNLHDLEGKMITEVPTPTMDGNEVEISSSSSVESGKYYILRAYDYSNPYTFYYVMTFDRIGTIKLNWLCFTENEMEEKMEEENF